MSYSMKDRRKRITRADAAGIAVTLVVSGVAVWMNWSTLASAAGGLVEPSAEPSGERAEPCAEADLACNEWLDVQDSEVPAQPTAAQLIAEHHCWTMRDGAPANVDGIPGGAVIRVDDGPAEYTEKSLLIGAALDAALDGADNGVEGIAFCRGDS